MRQGAIEQRTSLWRLPAMQALVGVTSLGFASYCLTLASLPTYAVLGGAPAATAGLVTAVFLLVTILLQGTLPALTARFGAPRVLVAGLLAIGLPSPFYVVDDGLGWLCALSAVRGAGFAVLTVLGSTLAAQVAPLARRGESIGIYGLAIAVPNLIAVPAGVALVLDGHADVMAWLAASPLLGILFVPVLARAVAGRADGDVAGSGRAAALAALLPSAVLFAVTLAGGGVVTFLPIERPDGSTATIALLLFGVTGALSRWRAGLLADRLGGRLLLPVSVAVAAAGMVVLAVGLTTADPVLLVGAAVMGAGYGATQNLTLLAAFARAGEAGTTSASAVWNAAFDSGTAAGAAVLGLVAAGVGLSATYVLSAVLLAFVLPLGVLSTRRSPG
jgi:predicted MFS family arabinose efflux permease